MRTFAEKPKLTQQNISVKSTMPSRAGFGGSRIVDLILHLQRTLGNRAVLQLLKGKADNPKPVSGSFVSGRVSHDFSRIPVDEIQSGPAVNAPGDDYEEKADRISEQVRSLPESQLQCTCAYGGRCPKCLDEQAREKVEERRRAPISRQRYEGSGGETRDARAGTPLPPEVRGFFESRFGSDFGKVRVHDDGLADTRARRMGAVAFTSGSHIQFAAGRYQPWTATGRWVLAHELAHVLQQSQSGPVQDDRLSDGEDAAERQAHQAAAAVAFGSFAPAIGADGRGTRTLALTEAAFRAGLGTTPEQEAAINALFSNADFLTLWNYLRTCTAAPTRDLGPLALAVTPGLTIGGTVRFGGYSPASRSLEINPTKPEHVNNPSELVDTITHELIHAVFDLEGACTAAGSGPAPLGGAATIRPPTRASLAAIPGGAALDTALTHAIGPGASDPCGEFLDENAAAQQIIARVIQSNITVTHVGHPTLTFVNLIIRRDPAAFSFYTSCRSAACAMPPGPARVAAITDCSQRTIANFIPPAMTSALLPTRVDFDTNSHALRPDARETLQLVAMFLTSHSGTTVNLTGRTDASGSTASNLSLGQARADAVKAFLLAQGVPAAQIGTVSSVGQTGASHSGRAGFAERSVEIAP